jgi:hypothetical protein
MTFFFMNDTPFNVLYSDHRLSINRPTKRVKEKVPCDTVIAEKRWKNIYCRVNKFLKESHIETRLTKERALFLKINDINDISFVAMPDCHHCCSIAIVGMLIQ